MDIEALRVLDEKKMYADLMSLPSHWREATRIGEEAELPAELQGAQRIVWAGMGGSAIGGDLLNAVAGAELSIPFTVSRDYLLPPFVDDQTLVIAASYSGNTEETLSAVEDALERDARVLCLTTGGELLRLCRNEGIAHIIIPGGLQPRCGVIFLSVPVLIALARLGYCRWETLAPGHQETGEVLEQLVEELGAEESEALRLAELLVGRMPVIYGSVRLGSVLRRWQAQFNENAKTFAHSHVFPEMNHNEIEGWLFPREVVRHGHVIFLHDREDHPRVRQRMELTAALLAEELGSRRVSQVSSVGVSRMARVFSLVVWGDFTSYYLALLNGVDPSPVLRIERFKRRLAELSARTGTSPNGLID
ncbi:MAG: phosphate starvation-inducible protein PsiE [Candidatus Poribacteria bacterium]|nr:MAG: phosphate starvation-inducible protein PsiE [Candidatus Poribacteria bacterium]